MKHHHYYMKYLFVLLLFLPTSLMAQNKEEKMPGHKSETEALSAICFGLSFRNLSYSSLIIQSPIVR